jgi:hypothetical protein
MMSEEASIDKQMHTLDYDRALGDLLELDTIIVTIAKLRLLLLPTVATALMSLALPIPNTYPPKQVIWIGEM